MSALRAGFATLAGVVAGGAAVRVLYEMKRDDADLGATVRSLPTLLAADIEHVCEVARRAVADGRDAADAAREEFDVQVTHSRRRTKDHDD
jgi:hypothetical protein